MPADKLSDATGAPGRSTTADAVAPVPSPEIVTVGALEYPTPGVFNVIDVICPFRRLVPVTVPVAWTPPAPGGPIVTVGGEVYPVPGVISESVPIP